MSWNKFVVGIIFVVLMSCIAMSLVTPVSAQHPEGVLKGRENVVYVFSWVDAIVEEYVEDYGWTSAEVTAPVSSGSGVLINDDGYVLTAAHVIGHDEVDLQLAAIDAYILSEWWDWGYEKFSLDEFYDAYVDLIIEKLYTDEFKVYAEEVDYVYWYKEDEPHKVMRVAYRGDPETSFDIAVLVISVDESTPFLKYKELEPKEGMEVYAIGYPDVDVDVEFENAIDAIVSDPRRRPATFQELVKMAEGDMIQRLKGTGGSIEKGNLGTPTKMGEMTIYRFHGFTRPGLSGGPVVDEKGCGIGMMTWKSGEERGYFIPVKYLKQVAPCDMSCPAFEAIFALAGLLTVTYLLRRRG